MSNSHHILLDLEAEVRRTNEAPPAAVETSLDPESCLGPDMDSEHFDWDAWHDCVQDLINDCDGHVSRKASSWLRTLNAHGFLITEIVR